MFHVEQIIAKLKYIWKTTPDLVLFIFLVFLLPFGTRKFVTVLVPYSSHIFNEWSSFFIYGTDILLVIMIIYWLRRIINFHLEFNNKGKLLSIFILIFCVLVIISGFLSPFWTLGIYGAIRYILYSLLFLYAFYNIITFRRRLAVAVTLFAAGGIQAILGLWQFINQRSLGLIIFGESVLSTDINNVAEIIHEGAPILRAYGTFPHPNVLAYFLLAAFALGFYSWIKIPNRYYRQAGSFILGVIFMGLILTFSRAAWLAGALMILVTGGILIYYKVRLSIYQKKLRFKWRPDVLAGVFLPIMLLLVMVIGSFIVLQPFLSSRLVTGDSNGDMAVSMRAFLSDKALAYGKERPVLGWGPRSFVPLLAEREGEQLPAWMMQPVHNSWISLLYEIGFPGLVIFGTIIILRFSLNPEQKNVPRGTFQPTSIDILYVSIVSGLVIGGLSLMLFDHYILDVQQSSLLFWLLLGL